MGLETQREGLRALIKAGTELAAPAIQELREIVSSFMAGTVPEVIYLDLGDTVFIDSVGLGALVALKVTCQRYGKHLAVLRPKDEVLKTMEMMMLDHVLDVAPAGRECDVKLRAFSLAEA